MSNKSKSTTFLLCYFLGILGVHRFYLNKVLTGVLMLLTLGGLGIWWLVDSVLIAAGQMKDRQGNPLRTGAPNADDPSAGFWVRMAAFSVDGLILNIILSVLFMGLGLLLPLLGLSAMGSLGSGLGDDLQNLSADELAMMEQMGLLLGTGFGLVGLAALPAYFGIQHGSRHQATFGKRCFDIHVARTAGERVGYGRAVWRSICYLFSALPLCLGFIMAGMTGRKRALHDYMAGTRVLHVDATHDVAAFAAPVPTPAPAREPIVAVTPREAANPGIGLIILGGALIAAAAAVALS